MPDPAEGAPVVYLPERVDRRMRLGPFPSVRDALKFLCWAAAGAVLATWLPLGFWLPFPIVGFAVAVGRVDGESADERMVRWVRFRWIRLRPGVGVSPRAVPRVQGPIARRSDGRYLAAVRTDGVPLAYRPPDDLAGLFDRFRDVLRGVSGALVLRAYSVPVDAAPMLPRTADGAPSLAPARAGYTELVRVLCLRRRARRVDLFLLSENATAEGGRRVRERARALADGLATLAVGPTVLEGRALGAAVSAAGWNLTPPDP